MSLLVLTPLRLTWMCLWVQPIAWVGSVAVGTWAEKGSGSESEGEDDGCAEKELDLRDGDYRGGRGRDWTIRRERRTEGAHRSICTPRVQRKREDQDCSNPNRG
ncbi:hypothetical protein NDU88_005677 [Pleurodeles waltl]|uniref:Secreted protein n=1 Tax=Pleurodeles waltl TaxID=8319 RepID=A0AAV7UKP3_PLEWA|nr:hypothetical protein NDU88_005677 [Pleurodeles waltl]